MTASSIPSSRRRFLGRVLTLGASGLVAPQVLARRARAPAEPGTRARVAAEESKGDRWQIGCFTRPWDQYDYRVG